MKKAIALTLALILCLSLCACGSSDNEETAEQAMVVTLEELENEMENNMARAEQLYKGKLVKFENVTIKGIYSTSASTSLGLGRLTLMIDLPTDVLATLNKGDVITVVGRLSFTLKMYADLNNAYLITQ